MGKKQQSEQHAVLGALLKRGGAGEASVLAKSVASDLDYPSCGVVNEILDDLTSDGLVEIANPGEKARRWRLTEQGRAQVAAAVAL